MRGERRPRLPLPCSFASPQGLSGSALPQPWLPSSWPSSEWTQVSSRDPLGELLPTRQRAQPQTPQRDPDPTPDYMEMWLQGPKEASFLGMPLPGWAPLSPSTGVSWGRFSEFKQGSEEALSSAPGGLCVLRQVASLLWAHSPPLPGNSSECGHPLAPPGVQSTCQARCCPPDTSIQRWQQRHQVLLLVQQSSASRGLFHKQPC